MQIVIQDLMTNYDRSGKGKKTILILHGWADSAQSFNDLAERLNGYDVLRLDLPGFGGTEGPSKAWGIDDYAMFVADFLRKLEVKVDVIIGHSNGGTIVIRGIARDIIHVDKAVLLASAGVRRPYSFRNTALKVLAKSGKLILHISPKQARTRIQQSLYRRIGSDYMVAPHMKETFKKIITEDVLEDAHNVNVPVCLIYGDRDHATPQAYGALYADAMHDATLHIMEGSGHFVHLEEPEEVAKIITEFIA